tara:strand:+ start:17898 stop:18134 length:237 start_codon:yes stop_codon:yes gene_type:complete
MDTLVVGDLVRDKLNKDDGSYGIGVIVGLRDAPDPPYYTLEEDYPKYADDGMPGKRYDVYFTRFERTITFHGDYLEKV